MAVPTPSESLDLGPIDPGIAAGEPRPIDGKHPWAPSEFDRRSRHSVECGCMDCNPQL